MSIVELTSGRALEGYLIEAKGLKGKTLLGPVRRVLSAPNVFVFGEFINLENVQELKDHEDEECKKYYLLLQLFAYGTYADYVSADPDTYPVLTSQQILKLKQLTVVDQASASRVISYSVLMELLDITELREFEDLIIDCLYLGIIVGKLDQEHQKIQVDQAIGRDIDLESITDLLSVLSNWQQKSQSLMTEIQLKIEHAGNVSRQQKAHQDEFEAKLEGIKKTISEVLDADMDIDPEMMGMDPSEMQRKRARHGKGGGRGYFM